MAWPARIYPIIYRKAALKTMSHRNKYLNTITILAMVFSMGCSTGFWQHRPLFLRTKTSDKTRQAKLSQNVEKGETHPVQKQRQAVRDSQAPDPAPPPQEQALLRPGLVVNVSVVVGGNKIIEETGKRISERSTLTLPLLGSVSVANMTLEILSEKLVENYREYYVNPQVMVEFIRDDNREGISPWGYVTVLGRVKKPGRVNIPATRDMTLSGAIQQAGGFDTSARDTAILVTRRTASGQTETHEVNLRAVGARGRIDNDIVLLPDDVVFVPELLF